MGISLKAALEIVEEMIPPALAEQWDNVGLQVGDPRWTVNKIQVALDPTAEVVHSACRDGVDLLVTHHPLIFKPLKRIDLKTPQGAVVAAAISHRLAVYAAHTNFDRLAGGLNDLLANKIGLVDLRPLQSAGEIPCVNEGGDGGMGRIGKLPRAMTLKKAAGLVKAKLKPGWLRMAGRADLQVETAALCTGSGSSLILEFIDSGAQVYISGDLRYHDARTVEEAGLGLIDIGHFASEHLMVEALTRRLAAALAGKRIDIAVSACRVEKDPFVLV